MLDEAASNLDNDGEAALTDAILAAKARGAIVITVAHRPSALATCEKVLLLIGGIQHAYGPRDEVLNKIRTALPPAATSANLKVVHGTAGGGDR